MAILTDESAIRALLGEARTIAVLGIHDAPAKAAFYVPEYLHRNGYDIVGVNPAKVGLEIFGAAVMATLAEIGRPIDIVDVFRASAQIPGHTDDILAMNPRPRAVWFQLGIRNDAAAELLAGHGIDVVSDRCTLADHRAWGIGPVS